MNYLHLNENGRIPVATICPFKEQCTIAQDDNCHHKGQDHPGEFSCALARGFDMIARKDANKD